MTTIIQNGRIHYNPAIHGTFDEFHHDFAPSKTLHPQIVWIQVHPRISTTIWPSIDPVVLMEQFKKKYNELRDMLRLAAYDDGRILTLWRLQLQQYHSNSNSNNSAYCIAHKTKKPKKSLILPDPSNVRSIIDQIAKDHGCLSGKWLVFADSLSIDCIWQKLANLVVEGKLGISAKVSAYPESRTDDSRVICVYTENYLDTRGVKDVREAMRDLAGIHWKISYKPDIYTYLGLYENNRYGIPVQRYVS
ncbi:hypothetical protein HDU97_008152 [Phlyctochytrium planicorne]|nr:hypothetical protein HDU97_008152 [Phlyctochytrium planicorne]